MSAGAIGHLTEFDITRLVRAVAAVVPMTPLEQEVAAREIRTEMEIETGKRLDAARVQSA